MLASLYRHVLQYTGICGDISLYLDIPRHIQAISGHMQTYVVMYSHISPYLGISRHIPTYPAIWRHISSYPAISPQIWTCIFILGVTLVGLALVSVALWSLWSRQCTVNSNRVGRGGKRIKCCSGEGRVSILILLGMMSALCERWGGFVDCRRRRRDACQAEEDCWGISENELQHWYRTLTPDKGQTGLRGLCVC